MAKARTDEFSQLAYMAVTESAATTLTFNGISVFSNILTPKGMVIHAVQYQVPQAAYALLTATGDAITFGLAGDDGMSSISLSDAQVYDYNVITRTDTGVAASGHLIEHPVVKDFSDLPGGGILVPADRLYLYVVGFSIASAVTIQARAHFTLLDLTAQQYIELAQALRVLT